MSVYKIGLSFSNNDDEDDDVPYLVHTVSCYDTDLCEEMIRSMLHNFRYREAKTARTEFFMCPIETIVRLVNHIMQMVNDMADMVEESKNRLYVVNATGTTEQVHPYVPLTRTDNVALEFKKLHTFFKKHKDVGVDELMDLFN